jgi:hypothetical protein
MRPPCGNVFTLAANDRCDTQFEIIGRFDWPLDGSGEQSHYVQPHGACCSSS